MDLPTSQNSPDVKIKPGQARFPELAPLPAQPLTLDAFIPVEMAARAEDLGVKKATMGLRNTFFLSVMAGQFIALGAIFATTVGTGASQLPFGV